MRDERTHRILTRAADAWDKAEMRIKEAQNLRGEVVQAAVAELRYAGRRLIDAFRLYSSKKILSIEEIDRLEGYISEVENNCLRAEHDAIDSQCHFMVNRMIQIEEEFGIGALAIYFKESYFNIKSILAEIDRILVDSRGKRELRPGVYDKLAEEYLPVLRDFEKDLCEAEDFLIEQRANNQKEIQKADRRYYVTFGAAAVGIAFTIFFGLLAIIVQ